MELDGPVLVLERDATGKPTDDPVAAGFYDGFKPDPEATAEFGRPMVKPCVMVMVQTPGQNLELYDQPAKEIHKQRYPIAWKRYQEGAKPVEEGHTPLAMFPPMTRADVINYRAMGVHSVEGLVAVSSDNISRLGFGASELQTKAKAWLASATDNSVAAKLAGEKKALQDQLAAMQAQMTAMQAQFDAQRQQPDEAPAPQRGKKAA